jgi:hypothetical protein
VFLIKKPTPYLYRAFPFDEDKQRFVPEHFEKTFDSVAVSPYLSPTAG